jgi:hypothetical protein
LNFIVNSRYTTVDPDYTVAYKSRRICTDEKIFDLVVWVRFLCVSIAYFINFVAEAKYIHGVKAKVIALATEI